MLSRFGGERGIRTLEAGKGLRRFQRRALDHYATSPSREHKRKAHKNNYIGLLYTSLSGLSFQVVKPFGSVFRVGGPDYRHVPRYVGFIVYVELVWQLQF